MEPKFNFWIKGTERYTHEKYGASSPYFRKVFKAENVKKATLFATAQGIFQIYLNGRELSSDRFQPEWTDYSKSLNYVEYDLTEKLEAINCIGVVLGNGWYCGTVGLLNVRANYGEEPSFSAEIVIERTDGEREVIRTDATWKTACGKIIYNDMLHGEYHDFSRDLGDFSTVDYNDDSFAEAKKAKPYTGKIRKLLSEKISLHEEFLGEKIIERPEYTIYDFGQNFAGIPVLVVKGEKGTKIRLRYGEMLDGDALYTANLREAEATDYVVLSGGEDLFEPLFTFHGFRYAEFSVICGKCEIISFSARAVYSGLEQTGNFHCDNQLVNQIFKNVTWSQKSNSIGIPTDCPQRDERLGWTGDVQIFCETAMLNMNCKKFYENYMYCIEEGQRKNGAIPVVIPDVHAPWCEPYTGVTGWSDVCILLPYRHYLYYGDRTILERAFPVAEKYVGYCSQEWNDYIMPDRGFGDWLSIDDDTDKSVLATAFTAYSCAVLSSICKILGNGKEKYYDDLSKKIKEKYLEKFVDKNGRITSDTQTAYLTAYAFGILGKEILPHLVRTLERKNYRLSTGFIGVKYLLPVLTELGMSDLAYGLICSTEYPSWGYTVKNGATTIWERWNSYSEADGFGDVGMNSFNHYSLGSCVEWLYKYVAGINYSMEKPAFKKVVFRPYFCDNGKIQSVNCVYKSANGRIKVNWEIKDDEIFYTVSVPDGVEVEFEFENKVVDKRIQGNVYSYRLVKVSEKN